MSIWHYRNYYSILIKFINDKHLKRNHHKTTIVKLKSNMGLTAKIIFTAMTIILFIIRNMARWLLSKNIHWRLQTNKWQLKLTMKTVTLQTSNLIEDNANKEWPYMIMKRKMHHLSKRAWEWTNSLRENNQITRN